ncbi:MAG: hypothetical protein ACFCAD_24475 [Pleurocapsa sp.]
MNSASLPISILFFAVVYLVTIYGLLTIAQIPRSKNNLVNPNSEEGNNQVEIL